MGHVRLRVTAPLAGSAGSCSRTMSSEIRKRVRDIGQCDIDLRKVDAGLRVFGNGRSVGGRKKRSVSTRAGSTRARTGTRCWAWSRENGCWAIYKVRCEVGDEANSLQKPDMSSPSAMRQLSSRLSHSNRPCWTLITHSPPNWNNKVDVIEGFSTILALFSNSY